MKYILTLLILAAVCVQSHAQSREWCDKSGHYKFKAELLAQNESSIVLQRSEKKDLLIVDKSDLCEDDQKFLEEHAKTSRKDKLVLKNGLELSADVIEYGRREVTLKRSYGRLYVNDTLFKNLPEVYRRMIPNIVNQIEGKTFGSDRELSTWVGQQQGQKKTYTLDGVMLELENGDRYGVPFFLFSDADQQRLKPGFEKWSEAAQEDQYREDLSLEMQARYEAEEQQHQEAQQMRRLSLQVQAYDSGLFDLWEVEMLPRGTQPGYGYTVVVPGRNSEQAAEAALAKYPGYNVGAIAKLRRRWR